MKRVIPKNKNKSHAALALAWGLAFLFTAPLLTGCGQKSDTLTQPADEPLVKLSPSPTPSPTPLPASGSKPLKVVFDHAKAVDSQSIHGIAGAGVLTMTLTQANGKNYTGEAHFTRTFDYGGGTQYEDMTIFNKMEIEYSCPKVEAVIDNAKTVRENDTLQGQDEEGSFMIIEPLIQIDEQTLEARGYFDCTAEAMDNRVIEADGEKMAFNQSGSSKKSIPYILSIKEGKATLYMYPHHLSMLIFEGSVS